MQGRMAAMNLNPASSSGQPEEQQQPQESQASEEQGQAANAAQQPQFIPPNLQEIHIPPFPTAGPDLDSEGQTTSLFQSYNASTQD